MSPTPMQEILNIYCDASNDDLTGLQSASWLMTKGSFQELINDPYKVSIGMTESGFYHFRGVRIRIKSEGPVELHLIYSDGTQKLLRHE